MIRPVALILASLATLVFCAGCPTLTGTDTFKVSGTVTGGNWTITSNALITVTSGSQTYSVSVPAAVTNGSPSAAYSVAGVPKGTYSLKVVFTESTLGPPTGPQTTYSINGGSFNLVTSDSATGSGPSYDWTVELDNVSLSADTTVDFDLGCGGC